MSVSQASDGARQTSRRRRRGGRGGGNSRGDARPNLWEEGSARMETLTASSNRGDGDYGEATKQQNGGAPTNAPARGSKGKASTAAVRSGGGGRQAKEGRSPQADVAGVHPAMLESEFLASTGQADADTSGVASLSLEEVPYDRDLRWCNTASASRPRPSMDTTSGIFGRVGSAITQDTGDYERLDRHYQELWKDREEHCPPPSRGRGNRAGRGGRSRPRGSTSGGGGGGRNGVGLRSSTTNGPGREDAARHGTPSRRDRGGNGAGRTGSRGGKGGSRSLAEKGSDFANGGRGGGQRSVAAPPHSNGAGGAGVGTVIQKRGQKGVADGAMGRGSGGGARGGAVAAARGGLHPTVASSRSVRPVMSTAYRVQGPAAAAVAAVAATATAAVVTVPTVPLWQGRVDGGSPARAAINGHPRWEGRDQTPRQPPNNHHNMAPGFGPWAMEPGQSRSPVVGPRFSPGQDRAMAVIRTPPLLPAMSPLVGGRLPDSPEYLGDLANALSVTPLAARTMTSGPVELAEPLTVGQQSLALSPPLGPALLGGTASGDRNGFGGGERGGGGGGGGGVMPAQNGGDALLPYLSPLRSKAFADIRALADPSLEVDIQDICADPDLNVNAPAFVPGGYLSTY